MQDKTPSDCLTVCEVSLTHVVLASDTARAIDNLVMNSLIPGPLRDPVIEAIRALGEEVNDWNCYDRDRSKPNKGPIFPPHRWGNQLQDPNRPRKKLQRPAGGSEPNGPNDRPQVRKHIALDCALLFPAGCEVSLGKLSRADGDNTLEQRVVSRRIPIRKHK